MPLAMVSVGEKKTIREFHGSDEIKRHLSDLGFIPGEQVEVLADTPAGLILRVKGVRLALNRGLAQRIMVA